MITYVHIQDCRSSYFYGSTRDDSSRRGKVYSRHDPFISSSASSSSIMKNCPFSMFFEKPALEQSLVNFCCSRSSANFCSYSRNKFPVTSGPNSHPWREGANNTEYRMSTFGKVEHHAVSSFLPFSIRLFDMGSVPFFLRSRRQKRPMSSRESPSMLSNSESIRNTIFCVPSFSPINVIVH